MQDAKSVIHEKMAKQIIENMKPRNISASYFFSRTEAVKQVCTMIPDGSLVGLGGSTTLIESGLLDALRGLDINLLDRYKEGITHEEVMKMRKRCLSSDVFIASANAITYDGKIVCEDGLGNRVASILYGPEKVILLVGVNKFVPTVEDAFKRIKTVAAPLNSIRFSVDTPCARTGFCDEATCLAPERICGQIIIVEHCMVPNRINVVFVGENLGY